MLLSWCGLRSCMRGFSVWRNISSTRLWCSTPLRQKLELWARTIKSLTSSKALLILSPNYFTSIYILLFSIFTPRGYVLCVLEPLNIKLIDMLNHPQVYCKIHKIYSYNRFPFFFPFLYSSLCKREDISVKLKHLQEIQHNPLLCGYVIMCHWFLLRLFPVQQPSSVHLSSRHEAAAFILLCPIAALRHTVLHHALLSLWLSTLLRDLPNRLLLHVHSLQQG